MFLLAKAEGVRHVDLYVLKFFPDHKVFLDQGIALLTRFLVPVLMFAQGYIKIIFPLP